MKSKVLLTSITLLMFLISCGSTNMNEAGYEQKTETVNIDREDYSVAYFAAGCFWCVEAIYESIEGVAEVVSGYSGGIIKNPTYEKVSAAKTKHAEAVAVYYDAEVVSFETLVKVFFGSHDPTTLNQQGPDQGPQYRSIAFYETEDEKQIILKEINRLTEEKAFYGKIVTQVSPFKVFYKAEDYHQNYERLHPNQPYVKAVSIPRLNAFKKKFPEILKVAEKLH